MKLKTEELAYKALKLFDNDRYRLTTVVSQRASELSQGVENLLDIDTKNMKFSDIALIEILEERLIVEDIS